MKLLIIWADLSKDQVLVNKTNIYKCSFSIGFIQYKVDHS